MNPQYINSLLPTNMEPTLQFLAFLIILSFIPLIFLTTTPFLRIAVVMSLVRQAIGVQQIPPNLVITGMALILTLFVMEPTLNEVNQRAIAPLARKEIDLGQALVISYEPMKKYMLRQVDEKDIKFFYDLTDKPLPSRIEDVTFAPLVSAHLLGELRIAFSLGFLIFIPFLVIDLIVTNVLLALGAQMMTPTIISLPFKILIFVAIDGWALIIKGLVESFK
ncbi:MAG: flagellar type III secretion system pore protein FliP [Candidatus Melainabacteria bacterium]|jgi:flagellar biosynthetic protein FliP